MLLQKDSDYAIRVAWGRYGQTPKISFKGFGGAIWMSRKEAEEIYDKQLRQKKREYSVINGTYIDDLREGDSTIDLTQLNEILYEGTAPKQNPEKMPQKPIRSKPKPIEKQNDFLVGLLSKTKAEEIDML